MRFDLRPLRLTTGWSEPNAAVSRTLSVLKSESHAYRRRVAESFLINQKACSCNVIDRNDGANFPTVYSVFVSNK